MVKLEGKKKSTNIKGRKEMLGFWPIPRKVKYNKEPINLKT